MRPFYEFLRRERIFDSTGIFYLDRYVWRDVFSGDVQARIVATFWNPPKPLSPHLRDYFTRAHSGVLS